ncbi:acetate--CoA ligase family protein [Cupriavidus plantarum]|uniref:acetate--CoA ligase family protein n=1 Tax=Cupriavidus plantarum TaxID=942865 RepID=UPI001B1CC26C|nr:acetate--CoA ligase [Cupriavidus plantarum]CAG2137137.1 Trans-feruloyl-CoA synthase FCS1 [Cupriavidus plantarum]SMR84865.1 Acyl-CoA synthetase (NDP forming) [Cupriavidus plantarum]
MTETLLAPLDAAHDAFAALFHPSSVAVIGASDNPNKVGGRPIHYMRAFGYTGEILPVNPARDVIQGLPAYAGVADLVACGKTPEAAIVAVSGDATLEQVRLCAEAGVKAAVIMASGFAETGAKGRERQQELVRVANAGGMRLVGPNAQGTANFAAGAVLNFSTMFMEVAPQDGPIAIISQSGAASVMPYALLRQAGHGVRYLVATGNDADLDACAIAAAVAADPDVRLLLVYLETISNPDALARAAAIARARGASIVAIKAGNSARGAQAAASHTGALVGNDAAIDAFLVAHGIWRAGDIGELVRAVPLYLQDHAPGAGRTVVMSHSGAVGVMAADLAERHGLPLAALRDDTLRALGAILPEFGTANNPLDMTAALLGKGDMFPRVLEALGADPAADMVMVGIPVAGPGYDVEALARDAAAFSAGHRKPLVASAPQQSVREVFVRHGVPTFVTEADAVAALAQYAAHRERMARVTRVTRVMASSAVPAALPLAGNGLQDEARSLALLAEAGVPTVPHRLCGSASEAGAAFEALRASSAGAAVVVKGCAASVPHKSEHGLVHLRLTTRVESEAAAQACLDTLRKLEVREPRIVVAQMVKGRHEFALGVSVDPMFGPLVMIGEGGTLLELRKDIVTLLAPFTVDDVRAACARLRVAPLFTGYRDVPALDLDALASAAVALGNWALRHRHAVRSVDINPLMLMAAGEGVIAVDAVVQLQDARTQEAETP